MSHLFPGRWLAAPWPVLSQNRQDGEGQVEQHEPQQLCTKPLPQGGELREEFFCLDKPSRNSAHTQLWVPALISAGFSGWRWPRGDWPSVDWGAGYSRPLSCAICSQDCPGMLGTPANSLGHSGPTPNQAQAGFGGGPLLLVLWLLVTSGPLSCAFLCKAFTQMVGHSIGSRASRPTLGWSCSLNCGDPGHIAQPLIAVFHPSAGR